MNTLGSLAARILLILAGRTVSGGRGFPKGEPREWPRDGPRESLQDSSGESRGARLSSDGKIRRRGAVRA